MNKTEKKKIKNQKNLWRYVKSTPLRILAAGVALTYSIIGSSSCDVAINPVPDVWNYRDGLDPVGLYLNEYKGITQEGFVEINTTLRGYKITKIGDGKTALGGNEVPALNGGSGQEQKCYYADFLITQTEYDDITQTQETKYVYFFVDQSPLEKQENEKATKELNSYFKKIIGPSKAVAAHIEVFDEQIGLEDILDDVENGLKSAEIELNEQARNDVYNYLKDRYN